MEISTWKEMSYNKFENKKVEIEKDFYQLPYIENNNCIRYGLYENIYAKVTFSVDDLFTYGYNE